MGFPEHGTFAIESALQDFVAHRAERQKDKRLHYSSELPKSTPTPNGAIAPSLPLRADIPTAGPSPSSRSRSATPQPGSYCERSDKFYCDPFSFHRDNEWEHNLHFWKRWVDLYAPELRAPSRDYSPPPSPPRSSSSSSYVPSRRRRRSRSSSRAQAVNGRLYGRAGSFEDLRGHDGTREPMRIIPQRRSRDYHDEGLSDEDSPEEYTGS